ncbi:out at first protein-like [Anneissia japonica]|uniref:out at first protein-like n=1 Tax=Anneissia japonica TaxID=1529436 RepID=UPI0014259D7D|nr:out at first protein-like [Anneissia japonica]
MTLFLLFAFILSCTKFAASQLVVNVKNKGGDLIQENIQADIQNDLVRLNFQRLDGTLVSNLIDFKAETKIQRLMILGEQEREESRYQVICFVSKFNRNDFISSDSMSKLRQKNPGTIRTPEEDLGIEDHIMNIAIDPRRSSQFSKHIENMCSEAKSSTYTSVLDIKGWSKGSNITYQGLMNFAQRLNTEKISSCASLSGTSAPCACTLDICIGWYPCGLKYCHGRDAGGKIMNYRCGIKTCSKCHHFTYKVQHRNLCLWGV